MCDIAVVGGGPAGLSAAVQARARGKSVVVIGGDARDNALYKTRRIDNYLGFFGATGPELLERFEAHAREMGVERRNGRVLNILPMGTEFYLAVGSEVEQARAVVLATGVVQAGKLPGEAEYLGAGVSYCATCDGMLYRGREVAIVGGGNTAVGDALTLARLAGRVTLIHRRDALRASAVYLDKLRENGVNIVWNTEVKALQGDDRLTGLVLRNKVTGEESTLPVDGLFVAVGRRPETALFRGQLETDEAGYLIADETTRTSLPGVYAVGDVRRKPVRQILTAAADGAVAAHYIEEYLAGNRA